jgi:hypothetical protein
MTRFVRGKQKHIQSQVIFLRKENAPTNPCPIFSNRVYFFLGSPTLTMLPLKERDHESFFKIKIQNKPDDSPTPWSLQELKK